MTFKPLLAETLDDTSKVPFPVLVSAKLDGIRAIVKDGVVYSRSMKPIRNRHVQNLFGREKYNGLDGELVVGAPNAPDVYLKTNSGVMSAGGEPDVFFYAFDRWDMPDVPYETRYHAHIVSKYASDLRVGVRRRAPQSRNVAPRAWL